MFTESPAGTRGRRARARRCALGAALTAGLLLTCVPQAWSAASLSVTLSTTTAGTASEPAPVTLTGDFTASPAVPSAPERVTSLVFTVPVGMTMGGAPGAPSCSAATVNASPDLCPTGSRVGFGTHDVIIGGAPVTVTVTAFNAPGGQSLNMLSQALGSSLVTTGTLDASKRTLTTQWAPAPAPAMQLARSRFTFGPAPGVSTSWVTASGCGTGTWSFSNTVNGSDATSPSATADVACTQGTGFVPPRRPRVWTSTADFGTTGTGRVPGGINAQGSMTTYFVEYGETTAYGRQSAPATTTATQPNAWWFNGAFPGSPVERTVGGLADGTDYHARMVAVNAGGTTYGNDVTFTTNDPDRNPPGCPFGPGLTDGWRSDYFSGGWAWDSAAYEAISAHVILWWNPIAETVHWGDGSPDETFDSTGNTQSHLFPHQYTWNPAHGNPNVRAPRIDHKGKYTLNGINVDCEYAHRGWPLTLWGSFASAPRSVGGVPHDGEITATWAPPETTGGAPITQYTAIAAPSGRMCTAGATPPHSCDIEGLTNGTPHTVTVFATTAAGEGPDSAASPPVVPATVPGPPGTPTATAGTREATVAWTAPPDTGGSPITGYEVTASPGGKTCTTSGPFPLNCKVTGLADGTAYTFKVLAKNAIGSGPQSASSNEVTTSLGKPGPPGSVTAVAGDAGATVSWTAPPATAGGAPTTAYMVTASPHGQQCMTTGLSCLVEDLDNGIAYTFTVVAMSAVGDGPSSAPSNAVTPSGPPGPPRSVTGVPGDGQVSVAWQAADAAGSPITGYTVTATPGGAQCSTSGGLGCVVTGLVNGTGYTFTVVAANAHGEGVPSQPSATIAPVAPVVPVVPAAVPQPLPLAPPAPGPGVTQPTITVTTTTMVASVAPGGTFTVPVTVTCPATASGPCTVTVTIVSVSASTAASNGGKHTLRPGATIKPKVKLDKRTLKRLRRAGKLKLRMRVTVKGAGGAPTSRVVSVTVRRR